MRLFYLVFLISHASSAYDFQEVIKKVGDHSSVKELQARSNELKEQASSANSWGDPMLKLAAKNFPKDSLKKNETPMTGIEVGISQKISLVPKYHYRAQGIEELSQSKVYESSDLKRNLIKSLWSILIDKKRIESELSIFKENANWLNKMIAVSKKLYSNGNLSQQALLELQIRLSELDSSINNKAIELSQLSSNYRYFSNLEMSKLNEKTIPWQILKKNSAGNEDFKEKSIQQILKASDHKITAAKLDFIPDMTVSFGYTKRANIDDRGDFVSASISFPMPFSSKKYSNLNAVTESKIAVSKAYLNYKNYKEDRLRNFNLEISKLKSELDVLNKRTVKLATSSKEITAKSYQLGRSTYSELLQSELNLQKILLRKANLEALLLKNYLSLKYQRGDTLHE
ncbi:TolC family protein [Halobacteriovorax sp. GB3]|uniref:TolC family protein n=1 Tax=Halobacteriovorax sp. GB3 TaxID=2719615 RepID=UPI00236019DB|nr:TolC family protein [Halobacteriovorax sp. GB3]MDD0851741.1 TolC family protein [Halobacteriovorax sp. GB3]